MTGVTDTYLSVERITKRFGSFTALSDVSFTARRGEFISILGPSGCGKTTILRAVAGLDPQDDGQVRLKGRDVSTLPVSKRHVGIVFQSYALFPNLSAKDNVAYGLRKDLKDKRALNERVDKLLTLVGLASAGNKFPSQLSGGQQQRVALARALALSPDLLLLDEPLSALDAQVRVMLRTEIRALTQRLGMTTIMVTHDQEEALTMADRILIMNQGKLIQNGSPSEIYEAPATPFVASFIGSMNFLKGDMHWDSNTFRRGNLAVQVEREMSPFGKNAMAAIRPEDIRVSTNGEAGPNVFEVEVDNVEYRGPIYRVSMRLPSGGGEALPLVADISAEQVRRTGVTGNMRAKAIFPADRVHLFRAEA
ncbi:putative 2-aminoethylphosphonate ABC transporter ATP-binding protein [Pseudodesulfovibrio sp.]|uniref:putative 2-aminoethylphosphonate ABC transporter ATP-binding protein n=1 Tax=unclassified Pseudodesulfovibrio TaxID=2661612 RepID=UPI003B00B1AE